VYVEVLRDGHAGRLGGRMKSAGTVDGELEIIDRCICIEGFGSLEVWKP